jgi:flagellar hook-associated protein 1 FlgK
MSLSSVLKIGASGLVTAQAGLRTVSDNISNVNTPGYVRKTVDQQSIVIDSRGQGVEVAQVVRAADVFLQRTALAASSEAGRAGSVAGFLDRAQSLFGDPSTANSFFSQLDRVFSGFANAAEDATSPLRRSAAITEVTRFFDQAKNISHDLTQLSLETDTRLAATVDRINGLLGEITKLNTEISRAVVGGRDATGAENVQSRLIDELSGLMDVKLTSGRIGGVVLRAGDGTELIGPEGAAQLSYSRGSGSDGLLSITPFRGEPQALASGLRGGALKGLVELKQDILPGLAEQLGEISTRVADALNKAHNASSAAPPPKMLEGRDIGLDLETAISGFTGQTSVSIVDATGVLRRKVDITFNAGSVTLNGTTVGAGDFLSQLNAELDPAWGVASFSADGRLKIEATEPPPAPLPSTTKMGVVVADPPAPAVQSDRGGRGFSHFFGLNDLVRSDRHAFYETGLRPSDPHGFTTGQTVTFRLTNDAGGREQDLQITIPSGGSMDDLLNTLNDGTTGFGYYGRFTLDTKGSLTFASQPGRTLNLSVLQDNTSRAGSGATMSSLFGLGPSLRASRAESFSVNPVVAKDQNKLAFAQFDTTAAVGTLAISKGNNRGAFALAEAGERTFQFQPAGDIGAVSLSVSRYAAELGGSIGRRASYAAERKESADLLAKESNARRSSVEGVNLDEELIALTTYQQAYNASARLIQAASEMYETLVNMI